MRLPLDKYFPKPRSVTTIPLIIAERSTADLRRMQTTFEWMHRFAFVHFKQISVSMRTNSPFRSTARYFRISFSMLWTPHVRLSPAEKKGKKKNIAMPKWYGRNEKRRSTWSRRKILTQARGWDRLTINRINMTYGTARRRVGGSRKWDLNWMKSVYRPYVDRSSRFAGRGRRGAIRGGKLKWWKRCPGW